MNGNLTRRDVVAALGTAMVAQALPAADAGPAKVCLTLTYLNNNPANKNMKFDAGAFRETYLPALKAAYGDSLERVELRMPLKADRSGSKSLNRTAAPAAGPPSIVDALISMWIRDLPGFASATQKAGVDITAKLLKVTNGQPHVQYEEVIGEWGQPRASVAEGTTGSVMLYPNSEGATWDAEYFMNTYLPKMTKAYGEAALKRVEVRRGVGTQGGGKPLFLNVVHLYAENADRFMGASFQSGRELAADAQKISAIFPFFANVSVLGVG